MFVLGMIFLSGCGKQNNVACTADAMMCPDGSYVGRTGTNCEFVCPKLPANPQSFSEVMIYLEKNEYQKGEVININVKNGLDRDILYYSGGDRDWSLEYFNGQGWEEKDQFQIVSEDVGEECYIIMYEQVPPITLESGANFSSTWNQNICPYGNVVDSQNVEHIGEGEYRFVFNYGHTLFETDEYSIKERETVYSNVFVIK